MPIVLLCNLNDFNVVWDLSGCVLFFNSLIVVARGIYKTHVI